MGQKATEAGKRFQETAVAATRQAQESAKNINISSPIPDNNAAEDLKKAANLIRGFIDKDENESGFDNIIPPEVLRQAKGLAIYTVIKAVSVWCRVSPLILAPGVFDIWLIPSCQLPLRNVEWHDHRHVYHVVLSSIPSCG